MHMLIARLDGFTGQYLQAELAKWLALAAK